MPTIAIFAPMKEELDALLALLPPTVPRSLPGLEILETEFHGKHLVLARSGVGKVNTAMNATIVLAHRKVDAVLNVGTAGGLRQDQKILDLVVPEEVLAVDVDVTPLGFAYGQILGGPPVFFTDPTLRKRFDRVARAWPDMPAVHRGAVGTGDTFVNKPRQVEQIRERFGRDRVACVEMEGAALAQVCLHFGVPCLIVRSLSDVPAAGEENHLDFPVFLERAAHNAARLLVEMLQED
ncbi:MAG TPA: 5'-methylthioadenosine/adenosylhomocysteine nucleosidase [Fibrobacteria bacterium]|nr:5'-methylthioadenosine/adenosylhomocysteine nucleosidase [Fibrobacteria bacterium]HOX50395.1 5'-methylthioadenosine/adenosylhomocysteine nucleosidase [Fibrobacteria bacterium]